MLLHVFSPFSEVSFLNVKVQNVIKMYTYFSSHFAQTSEKREMLLDYLKGLSESEMA